LDTNVIVSATLTPRGFPQRTLDYALSTHPTLFVTDQILAEYEATFRKPKLRVVANRGDAVLTLIRKKSRLVTPRSRVSIGLDPDDNMFLECAETAHVDYLITGNKRHFPSVWRSTKIVSAREFIEELASDFA
jgi:putative PIN family toxin of toxin-antitoxin system